MKTKLLSTLALTTAMGIAAPVAAQDEPAARQGGAQQPAGVRGGVRDPLDPLSTAARQGAAVGSGGGAGIAQFNPAVSVILDGVFYVDSEDGEAFDIIEDAPGFGGGHSHGHGGHGDHGELEEGFNLRETEITFSATVDPYFDAVAVLAIDGSEGVELEEAYGVTRALPGGMQIKFGRFLSDVGYINKQHPHDWDFVDRPLVSELLFGDHGIQENGVQFTWLPPTRTYTRLGVELLQGETPGIANYVGEGRSEFVTLEDQGPGQPPERVRWRTDYGLDDVAGPRLFTGFAKWAPDLGFDHALQLGVSGGYTREFQQVEEHSSARVESWEGDAWFAGVDAVYKYDAGRSFGHGDLTVQAEYFYRQRDLTYRNRVPIELDDENEFVEDRFDQKHKQDGAYLQAVYGVAPRWRAGARWDVVGINNQAFQDEENGGFREQTRTSSRYTGMVTFLPTEFSRLRLQFSRGDIDEGGGETETFNQLFLQYQISIGAHGAHAF